MTGDRVAEIAARLEAATPGPWVSFHSNGDGDVREAFLCPPATGAFLIEYGADRDQQNRDAILIANAPSDLAFLLADNAALRGRLAAARKIGVELQMLPSKYTRAKGENGDRIADLLTEDAYNAGTRLRAALATGEGEDK